MFIPRNYDRTEDDDFTLNVIGRMTPTTWCIPQYVDDCLVGWKLLSKYE